MPNSSAWQLATASQGASPDSSLLSLLVNSASAQNATNGMTTNIDTTDASLNLTNATFDQAYAAMQSAGAVIPPDAVREPSDAISSIRSIYSSTSTSPIALRSKLLQPLFYDFMNSGSWGRKHLQVFHHQAFQRVQDGAQKLYFVRQPARGPVPGGGPGPDRRTE